MRPFLHSNCVAIHARALALLEIVVWVKQFVVAIKYRAFLNDVQGNMVRTLLLTRTLELGRSHEWFLTPSVGGGGVGGLLVVDGKVVFRFATNFDEVDEKAVGM